MRVLIIFWKKIAKNDEAAGVCKKIKLRVESVKPAKSNEIENDEHWSFIIFIDISSAIDWQAHTYPQMFHTKI